MDKATLKALILAKGQELGLDPSMVEQMLNAKPQVGTKDQLDIANSQATLDTKLQDQQFQVEDREVAKQAKQLDLEAKKLTLDQKKKEAAKTGGLTADEKKQQMKLGTLSTNLKVLEQNLNQVEQRGVLGGGFGKFLAGVTGGAAFGETADYEALRKGLIGPVARAISGEVGVLTDRDISRAEQLLPKVTDDPKLAERKLANLNQLIQEQGGKNFREEVKPEQTLQNKSASGNPVIDFLLGSAINTAKDSGAGITANITEKSRNQSTQQAEQQAQQLESMAQSSKDPAQKVELFRQANQLRGEVSRNAMDVSNSFSPDIKQSTLERSLTGGSQIAATAEIPALVTGITKTAAKVLRPFKTVGELRNVAIKEASEKTISGNGILDDILKKAKTVSPTEKKSYEAFIDQAKSMLKNRKLSMKDALELKEEANKAFTAAGKVGKSAKATFNKVMGDSIRTQIKQEAPNVAKADKLFSVLYGGKNAVRKYGGQAAVGAAGAGVTYALLSKLGIGR